MNSIVIVLICAFALVANLLIATPPRATTLAAIFPPWWAAPKIFAAAVWAGDVVRPGASPFVVIVRSRGGQALNSRLRQAGALILLDPRNLGLCSALPQG